MIYTLPGSEIGNSRSISPWRESISTKISVDMIEFIALERIARGGISAGEVIEDILFDHFSGRTFKDKTEEYGSISLNNLSRLHAYAVRQNLSDDEALQKILAVMETVETHGEETPCRS